MRLDVVGWGMIVLFLAATALGSVGYPVLGVRVAAAAPDTSGLEPPPFVAEDPSDPYTDEEKAQMAEQFTKLERTVLGDIAIEYAVERRYGSASVKLTWKNKFPPVVNRYGNTITPTQAIDGTWFMETSYGCSLKFPLNGYVLLHGASYEFVSQSCTTGKVLPPAPGGFVRWVWWLMVEEDAYREIWYERYAYVSRNVDPTTLDNMVAGYWKGSSWKQWHSIFPRDHDGYMAWLREQYATEIGTDYRGITYTEQSVAASCGGVWFPWAAPWGCATLYIPFKTVIATYVSEFNSPDDLTMRWVVNSDPVGLTSEKWPIEAMIPPAHGEPDWCYLYNCGSGDAKCYVAAITKLAQTQGFGGPYTFDPLNGSCGKVHPLMSDVNYVCTDWGTLDAYWGAEGYESKWDFPNGCPAGWGEGVAPSENQANDFLYPSNAFSIQMGHGYGPPVPGGSMILIFPECGSFGGAHDTSKPQCRSQGWEEVAAYMDKLSLIDKLLFVKYVWEHQAYRHNSETFERCAAECPLPSMSDVIANFDRYLATGDKSVIGYGLEEGGICRGGGCWTPQTCPLFTVKEKAARFLAGELDRRAATLECDSSGTAGMIRRWVELHAGTGFEECERLTDSQGNIVVMDCKAAFRGDMLLDLFGHQRWVEEGTLLLFPVGTYVVVDMNNLWLVLLPVAFIFIYLERRRRKSPF